MNQSLTQDRKYFDFNNNFALILNKYQELENVIPILLDDATNQIPLAPVDLNGVASISFPLFKGDGREINSVGGSQVLTEKY